MKSWYLSKTLWANALAAVALFLQQQYGYALSPELQAYILILLNVFLRSITSKELTA